MTNDTQQSGEQNTRIYQVVVNHEDQYSIWFADRELPLGWRATGKQGTKDECLAHIAEVWTDMRPRSIRGMEPGGGG
jgi:MbtH protein